MALTSYMRSWQDFDMIQLVILPMFLFSGTFYPLDAYPRALRVLVQLTPLYQGVDLLRSLSVGHLDGSSSSMSPTSRPWGSSACGSSRAASTSSC